MKQDGKLDFLVIGAMKAATTSVHKYLTKNTSLYLPPEKEAPFFSDDRAYSNGIVKYFHDFFSAAGDKVLLGTVTPLYMMNPVVPQRIKETCPQVKMIAILRDPVERAYSHYQMAVRVRRETRTFDNAMSEQLEKDMLEAARNDIAYWRNQVVFGEYGRILETFYQLFPREQILVLYMDELISHPREFMTMIFNFIGVGTVEIPDIVKKYHSSSISSVKSFIAFLGLNTHWRFIGKLLPHHLRRPVRFWLGLNRSSSRNDIDTSFLLSNETRAKLIRLYLDDALLLKQLTGKEPYWVKAWKDISGVSDYGM